MEADKVRELLKNRFDATPIHPRKRHIIFWYDDGGSFKNVLQQVELEEVKVFFLEKGENRRGEEIDTNIFELKYKIEVEDQTSHYLIYSEYERPARDQENFLLDIERYSEYFEADRAAMIVEELELDRRDREVVQLIRNYEEFFGSKERKDRLLRVLRESTRNKKNLELGILASLSGSKGLNIHAILMDIIMDETKLENIEKWMGLEFLFKQIQENFDLEVDTFDKFKKVLTVVHFYKGINQKPHVNLENHYTGDRTELFLFADNLLQNKQTSQKAAEKFYEVGRELNIRGRIDELEIESIVQGSTFEYFDVAVIHQIGEKLKSGLTDYSTYKKYINIRMDTTLWKEKYRFLYRGLKAAIDFFDTTDNLEIKKRNTLIEIQTDYTEEYYKVDRHYRDFFYSYDNSKGNKFSQVLEDLERSIGSIYENKFLDRLHQCWSEKISERGRLEEQKDFYNNHVKKSDTRVAVIISDGLRFEVGTEIVERLLKEGSSKEISLTPMVTDLPSITPIGMANLLPHERNIEYNSESKKATIEGMSTSSTTDREGILKTVDPNSSAITFTDFMKMHRGTQEEYIKGKRVMYIYHNQIDAIGDKGITEGKTFDACKETVEDIVSLTKILTSLGVVNTFITSDHGFLYEKEEVREHDKVEVDSEVCEEVGKRYALLSDEIDEKGYVVLEAQGRYGLFPHKNQRIKVAGSGLQYVHGGISPQEMIIPLIKYRSGAQATRARKVDVRLKESLGRITSNLSKFGLYQLDPVNIAEKIKERDVKVALYTDEGIRISTEERIRLNSKDANQLYTFNLTLSGDIRKAILKVIDLETDDVLDSKEYEVNLSIAAEFDF